MNEIQLKETACLTPYERNARKHSNKQINKIAASITQFGFNNPILIDKNNTIIAGHGRHAAAIQMGMQEVPTICLDHMSEDQIRAYVIADNKLAELAGWDRNILAIEFQHLASLGLQFDLEITGFDMGEIDFIIGGPVSAKLDPADDNIEPQVNELSLTKQGDQWLLGDHRLYCGDSLDNTSYESLMREDRAQMIFTDPPYNVPINGHVCGNGAVKHREFEMAVGEMTEAEFTSFIASSMKLFRAYSEPGSMACF